MSADRDDRKGSGRPPKKLGWIIGGALILILVVLALQGIIRGGGEAAGITQAAPGDDDASPASETVNSEDK